MRFQLRGTPNVAIDDTRLRHEKNAGMRKQSAANHAHMLEKHTPLNPNQRARPNATKQRAIISSTPASIANVE